MKWVLGFAALCVFFSVDTMAQTGWYKGNTHVHTVLCGHADSTPEVVTAWYHDRGYNFLILSEHNQYIDPETVGMPENKREDFILVPGEEVSGKKAVHSTAMNTQGKVAWKDGGNEGVVIQQHTDGIRAAGGHIILNHPNYKYAIEAGDLREVQGLYMFELYNATPGVNNLGELDHDATEVLWDTWLGWGMTVYGVASDDAHIFKERHPNKSNPGRGWVMVQSEELTGDALTAAMVRGDFYSSSGVMLSAVERSISKYRVMVDEEATLKALESEDLFGYILRDEKETGDGCVIEFIGVGGKVLKRVEGLKAAMPVAQNLPYVRCRVSYTHTRRDITRRYYAWTQPVFTDGREAIVEEAYTAYVAGNK